MKKIIEKDEAIRQIEKAYKPSLFDPIMATIVCSAPYGHLLLDIMENSERTLTSALISGPLLVVVGFFWTSYYYKLVEYKNEIRYYLENPSEFKW
ncbi:hypothetical protein [Anaerobranca gottschalkii]|uniref:Uncharacterized protein n=1 Tax=Anaerobranca gottschalkii DSM 13577 TaxID=1120990 RepID=A0A1I0B8T4_9FIRM|nr:hypothetical protein [Anaerobranca gottschalkii]SET03210.1 hypothetical protein SAMN03080614_103414 [Anaerobranca gottschalkii DSM 13577]